MGSQISVTPDADSVTLPGLKSVLSDELPLSYEDLLEGILDMLKDPAPPQARPALKSTEVTEKSDTEFIVKVTLDGEKLQAWGFGDGKGSDRVLSWTRVIRDKEDVIKTESYISNTTEGDWIADASDAVVYRTFVATILKDPVRIEYWMETPTEGRQTGQPIAEMLQGYLNAIVEMYKEHKVKVTPDLDSLKEPGKKSAISAPMDEHTTYDKLWDALTNWAAEFPQATIQQKSEKEVHVTGPDGIETAAGSLDIFYDKETGDLFRTHKIAGKLVTKQYAVLHKEPLQMELWMEDSEGVRNAGKRIAKTFEVMLEQRLNAANSWW